MKFSKVTLKSKFDGMPKISDFETVEEDLGDDLKDGEFFYEALYVSLDPYARLMVSAGMCRPGDVVSGYQLSRVTKSKNPKYPVGSIMVTNSGWRNGGKSNGQDVAYLRNDIPKALPQSAGFGILGMTGITAYYGLKYVCKPKAGETLMVSGAAGGVGTAVGQIGKIMGCRVIGSCGSDEKVAFVKKVGFDEAFNYKKETLDDALKRLAPNGIDCYFDNVGGDFANAVFRHMNMNGRIASCGCISAYNATEPVKAGIVQFYFIQKMLTMQGISAFQFGDKNAEIYEVLRDWASEGKLKAYEAVTEGFQNIPSTFIGMLQGKNVGKVVIKL